MRITMKTAEAGRLGKKTNVSLRELSGMMDKLQKEKIDTLNWKEYSYIPEVSVAFAYNDQEIFLKYYVNEKYFRAVNTRSNQEVYEDSCVEFFVLPGEDDIYYNFEFNAIGTCLMGTGRGRAGRIRAGEEVISAIRRLSTIVRDNDEGYSWTLTIAIPFTVFMHHEVKKLTGKSFRVNFYKCGDKLDVPHYVTWNPIKTENPDYHRPEYFGILKFI